MNVGASAPTACYWKSPRRGHRAGRSRRSCNLSHWIKTFTQAGKPGAYLRVISPGTVRAGDAITIDYRPDHDVTIGLVFRARMSEPELLPRLLVADALSAELKDYARRRVASNAE